MTELEMLLEAAAADPVAEAGWSVVADWLEENDDPRRARLLRLHRTLLSTCSRPYGPGGRAVLQAMAARLLAEGWRPCVPRRSIPLPGGESLELCFVPPGTFVMGSPEHEPRRSDDERPHPVTLTRGYWLGAAPVTQGQWRAVMGTDPGRFKGDGLPVE